MSRQIARSSLRSGSMLIMVMLSLWWMVGCERDSVTPEASETGSTPGAVASSAASTSPAANPATGQDPGPASTAASDPAATQPRRASMLIGTDRLRIEFPPARLLVKSRGGGAHATLFSDDPPEAMNADYTGNSFYLEMPLDVADVQQISTARWTFKAPNSERAETVSGIFINGRKQHLQPFDVVAEFQQTAAGVKVWISGDFLMFDADADPTIPGQLTPVAAELSAELTVKS